MEDKKEATIAADVQPPLSRCRVAIRVGRTELGFAVESGEGTVDYDTYGTKNGMSVAANLREAFRECELLRQTFPAEGTPGGQAPRVTVLADEPTLMLPIEDFRAEQADLLFRHTFTGHWGEQPTWTVVPQLNAVSVFPVNKDLRLVVDDHCTDARWMPVALPVWVQMHRRSYTGTRRKLYVYFHDRTAEIFAFQQNRFRFVNRFDATHPADVVYFVLNVWKQLGMDQQRDELHVAGPMPGRSNLQRELHLYLQNVYVVNPSADFNRAAATLVKGLPYDLMAFFYCL